MHIWLNSWTNQIYTYYTLIFKNIAERGKFSKLNNNTEWRNLHIDYVCCVNSWCMESIRNLNVCLPIPVIILAIILFPFCRSGGSETLIKFRPYLSPPSPSHRLYELSDFVGFFFGCCFFLDKLRSTVGWRNSLTAKIDGAYQNQYTHFPIGPQSFPPTVLYSRALCSVLHIIFSCLIIV